MSASTASDRTGSFCRAVGSDRLLQKVKSMATAAGASPSTALKVEVRGHFCGLLAYASQATSTLAEMIGTFARERLMNKFRRLGFIDYNGELKVNNSLLNVILHDAPGLRRETEDSEPAS